MGQCELLRVAHEGGGGMRAQLSGRPTAERRGRDGASMARTTATSSGGRQRRRTSTDQRWPYIGWQTVDALRPCGVEPSVCCSIVREALMLLDLVLPWPAPATQGLTCGGRCTVPWCHTKAPLPLDSYHLLLLLLRLVPLQ